MTIYEKTEYFGGLTTGRDSKLKVGDRIVLGEKKSQDDEILKWQRVMLILSTNSVEVSDVPIYRNGGGQPLRDFTLRENEKLFTREAINNEMFAVRTSRFSPLKKYYWRED